MRIMVLIFCLMGSVSQAAETFDPKVKFDFSLIKVHLEDALMANCQWDELAFTTPKDNEFYTEILCRDSGGYSYKFGTWLMYGAETKFRAESYAIAEGAKWYCVAEGEIVSEAVSSTLSCAQLEPSS